MTKPIWSPSAERIRASQMTRYIKYVNQSENAAFDSYEQLYDWSVTHVDDFWRSIWDFSQIVHSHSYDGVLSGSEMFNAHWFVGARLNFAENLLRFRDTHPAIIYQDEAGIKQQLTYAGLYAEVARCAHGLKSLGVTKGDRVVGYITNRPEAIIAMLAATSIGAIWSSCSPDFGYRGVYDRFGQITPKVLITIESYQYHGKRHTLHDRVTRLTDAISDIEHVVMIDDHGDSPAQQTTMRWEDLLDNSADSIIFEQLPFDHPVYIMYSSGTTGVPKCIVHGAGGTLLQHYKEHVLHTDLTRDDTITYFTTCGWMMWNWLVSALQVGATVFLYDGSPAYPDFHVLWRAIADQHITVFGTSPKFLTSCQNDGIEPGQEHELESLRTVLSTGAPLSGGNFEWVYRHVKTNVQLASISGGTDIISCFMLGNPNLPVYPGEIQCRGLGMKVETFDDSGRPVSGVVGELVCTAPFVSMPVFFWNDPDRSKYRAAYFEHFPGAWRHGDYIKISPQGGIVVYGRSDATLNPGGVRIGTAEIYGPVESLDEVEDSLVIGQRFEGDTRIVLFVVLADGLTLNDDLQDRIRRTIREQESPRHVPAVIVQVRDIPHTLNGKKVEIAVTRIIHGQDVPNRDALANPQALDQFVDLEELRR